MAATIEILIYHGKHGDEYWLADTPARKATALKELFEQLDDMGCYEGEEEDHLTAARRGSVRAIRGLLESRRCCEYENWDLEYVTVPETPATEPPGEQQLLDLNTYQKAAHTVAVYPKEAGLSYPVLGLAGEAGELANQAKKIIRDDGGKITPTRRAAMLSELNDVLWYVAEVATTLNADLSTIAAANLEKLFGRKERGTLHGSGDNR